MSIRDPDEESSPANIMKMDRNFCVHSDKLKNVVIEGEVPFCRLRCCECSNYRSGCKDGCK